MYATITIEVIAKEMPPLPMPGMSSREIAEILDIAAMAIDKEARASVRVIETVIRESR
jgi:hypothetical protein